MRYFYYDFGCNFLETFRTQNLDVCPPQGFFGCCLAFFVRLFLANFDGLSAISSYFLTIVSKIGWRSLIFDGPKIGGWR